jgi:hypothetical protein
MKCKVNRRTLQGLGGFFYNVKPSFPGRTLRGMNTTVVHFFLLPGKSGGNFANKKEAEK